ncbi:MAG: hypothetical protein L6R37_000718 [Teloschistes peruensis]|nr:MAG: hypothetical protein L6R37_000718 [Teloschistes peruensis]
MAPDSGDIEEDDNVEDGLSSKASNGKMQASHQDQSPESEEDQEEEEEEDEEPRLKYASVTKHMKPVYRNGDATSAFLVGGDKMIIGTHNGNIHVLTLPSLKSLKVYHAHSASVSAVSISPYPPPLPAPKRNALSRLASTQLASPAPSISGASTASPAGRSPKAPPVPLIASNQIYIATSSIDGNVCVASLTDPKDVMLRNFGRPVHAVNLSPDYKNDHSYLSGGQAGNLILTVGGRSGTTSTSNAGAGAAATASGWLGAIGLGSNTGKDTILHSGEGAIRTIQWSLSGRYVAWVNEKGIKLMRSNLHLGNDESENAWKRINHIDHPKREVWHDMAGVWKPQAKWVDETGLETDDLYTTHPDGSEMKSEIQKLDSPVALPKPSPRRKRSEKLIIGWGDTIWVLDVHAGPSADEKAAGKRKIAHVEILNILQTDCIVSGVSLYTPSLLVVLAYITPDENAVSSQTTPTRGRHRRQNALQPEIRLINVETREEVSVADTLNVSRYESLSATDYHLEALPAMQVTQKAASQRGALEIIGGGIWDVGTYPARLFSSAASVRSNGSQSAESSSRTASDANIAPALAVNDQAIHPSALTHGMKIFIQSPYDCVLATKPTPADHFNWLESHAMYEEAWDLLNQHPEAVGDSSDASSESTPSTPTRSSYRGQGTLMDFLADDGSQTPGSGQRNYNPQVEKEKRRVGELWVQQLTTHDKWSKAGATCGKVLSTGDSWEHWAWVFAQANKITEITPYIPSTHLQPPIPSIVYELVLGYYVNEDRKKLQELLERWPAELFDASPVIEAIQNRLRAGDIREDSVEDGKVGQDWRVLLGCLAKLYLDDGRPAKALGCYIRLQEADIAMRLISEYHLVNAVSDDIPGFIMLRISKKQQQSAPMSELELASMEPIRLLVSEAHHGIVRSETVIRQLDESFGVPNPYLFFYFRALWEGETTIPTAGSSTIEITSRDRKQSLMDERLIASEGKALVSDHADIALRHFAEYDRPLLMNFLKASQSYTLDLATRICKQRHYTPELVYLLAKEGRMTQALRLIIDEIGDVSQAITFAKEQNDQSLWDDLLNYSMKKPPFIRGLLEEVGTSIDPMKLVRKIPEGLEIEGLKSGLMRIIREYEIQYSISEGVARVLRGEVAAAMAEKGKGLNKGIKFEIGEVHKDPIAVQKFRTGRPRQVKRGHCPGCEKAFLPEDPELLISFPCQHVFHLPCLLDFSDPAGKKSENIPSSLTNLDRQSEYDRSIGPKIDHASLLRNTVNEGCPLENRDNG